MHSMLNPVVAAATTLPQRSVERVAALRPLQSRRSTATAQHRKVTGGSQATSKLVDDRVSVKPANSSRVQLDVRQAEQPVQSSSCAQVLAIYHLSGLSTTLDSYAPELRPELLTNSQTEKHTGSACDPASSSNVHAPDATCIARSAADAVVFKECGRQAGMPAPPSQAEGSCSQANTPWAVACRHFAELLNKAEVTSSGTPKYDPEAFRAPVWVLAFTRRREMWVGRTAMLGFLGVCVGECVTGQGMIGQLALETGLPAATVGQGLALLAASNVVLGALPGLSPTWSPANQSDLRKRRRGLLQGTTPAELAARGPLEALGAHYGPGANKAAQLLNGRAAMLGLGGSLAREALNAECSGPLAQLGLDMASPSGRAVAMCALASVCAGFMAVALLAGRSGNVEGDNDMY